MTLKGPFGTGQDDALSTGHGFWPGDGGERMRQRVHCPNVTRSQSLLARICHCHGSMTSW